MNCHVTEKYEEYVETSFPFVAYVYSALGVSTAGKIQVNVLSSCLTILPQPFNLKFFI